MPDLDELINRELLPRLEEIEIHRRAAARGHWLRLGIVVAAAAALAVLALAIGSLLLLIVAVAALPVGYFVWARAPIEVFRDRVATVVVAPICARIGDLEFERSPGPIPVGERFQAAGLVGRFGRSTYRNLFVGRHRGVEYGMVWARFKRRSKPGNAHGAGPSRTSTRDSTVFRGVLLQLDLPGEPPGRVRIGRDLGSLGNRITGWLKGREGLEPFRCDHPGFDTRFAVYASDPDAARTLLTSEFAEALMALDATLDAPGLRAALEDGQLLIARPTRRAVFEPFRVFSTAGDGRAALDRLLADITLPHQLIDRLPEDLRWEPQGV